MTQFRNWLLMRLASALAPYLHAEIDRRVEYVLLSCRIDALIDSTGWLEARLGERRSGIVQAFAALSPTDRQLAEAGAEAYLADLRKSGRRFVSLAGYLRERLWVGLD